MYEHALGPGAKGMNLDGPTTLPDVADGRPTIFADRFSFPLLSLSESALSHNIRTMADVCVAHGVQHAPHVKTAMSPQLYQRQAEAGAWGATVATPAQLRAVLSWGVRRVIFANELTDPRELQWLGRTLAGTADVQVWLWVDSDRGVDLISDHLRSPAGDLPPGLGLLVELGIPGGRTGVRTVPDALQLARRIHSAGLPLLGVAGYEGALVDHAERPRGRRTIQYVRTLRQLAAAFEEEGLRPAAASSGLPPVVSVGGSDLVDVIVAELGNSTADRAPILGIIRSGAYLTHDHGLCARANPWQFLGLAMQPAAQVWASVLSTPETGLALVNVGRRDVPFDVDLPVPVRHGRLGDDGRWVEPLPISGWSVTALNDQHAYLQTTAGPNTPLRPGDVVGFGISHPCTLFDKWRTALVVDDQLRVIDAVTTEF